MVKAFSTARTKTIRKTFVEEEKHIEKDGIRGLVLYLFTWVVKSGINWFKEGVLNSKDQKVYFTIKHKFKT